MFFRNALIYRLTQEVDFSGIEDALQQKRARPCASQETNTLGFIAPIGRSDDAPLAHVSNGAILIKLQREERILPGSVVKDALDEKIEEIEFRDSRKVYKKERDTLKDDIVMQLLPRAFVRKSSTSAVIMPKERLVIVDASTSKAEDLLSVLRECLGSLPVRPVTTKAHPAAMLTAWVKDGEAPNGLMIGDNCELFDTSEDGGSVRCKRQDLGSDEVQLHLSAGKQVGTLSVQWREKMSFTVDGKLHIKSLKFEDLLRDEAQEQGGDDMESQLDASFVIMSAALAELVRDLLDAFGGEDVPKGLGDQYAEQGDTPASGGLNDHLIAAAIESQRGLEFASLSSMQHALNIGYNRAQHIMQELELRGAVSAVAVNGTRRVTL